MSTPRETLPTSAVIIRTKPKRTQGKQFIITQDKFTATKTVQVKKLNICHSFTTGLTYLFSALIKQTKESAAVQSTK